MKIIGKEIKTIGLIFTFLKLPDNETFAFVLKDWAMWRRWEKAFKEGQATQESRPALPEDKPKHEELSCILADRLIVVSDESIKARAKLIYGNRQRSTGNW